MSYPIALYFGGTFDPIHNGHLQVVIEVADQLSAQSINLLPNAVPVHKQSPSITVQHRLNMCQLACQIDARLAVDSRELTSPVANYTIETLKQLNKQYPHQSICFVIGMDSLLSLDTWKDWQQLTNYAHLVVVNRGGYTTQANTEIEQWLSSRRATELAQLKQTKAGLVYFHLGSMLEISSSMIRARYQNQLNCACLLPDAVNRYIINHRLYQQAFEVN